jgi:hypothetical protein
MGITLIILLVPFGLYYVLYVSSHQSYFIDRSHRALAGIGGQIVSRIDGLRNVVLNANLRDCVNAGESDDPEDLFNPNTIKPFGVELQYIRSKPRSSPEGLPKPGTEPKPTARPDLIPTKQGITLTFERAGPTNRLVFHSERFSIAVPAEQLLGPVVDRFVVRDRQSGSEDLFDKIFVADSATGQVIFESGLDSTTIANLDDLLGRSPGSDSKGGAGQAAGSGNPVGERADGGQKPKDAKPVMPAGATGKPGRGSSSVIALTIGETGHKLFVQPIELTLPVRYSDGQQGATLTVCGLVRSDHLTERSFSFSYTLLLMTILLVLMVTLSGPLIKLKLLGPKDRLSKADALLTAGAAFCGTALLTLTLVDLYSYANLAVQLDDQLEVLAESVDQNLRSELASASDQLDALNNKLSEALTVAKQEPICVPRRDGRSATVEAETPSAVRTKYFIEDILGGGGLLDPRDASYPYFNSAIWVGLSGQQQIKFTTKRKHTPFISVERRRFYREAKEGKLWDLSMNRVGHEERRALYLEALNSRTSGENVAVMSKLTPDRDYVSAMDLRLMSLYSPVLPTGYGFCVIDGGGGVLFHADDVKNLEENFFDECNNDKLLRAAVQLRQREALNVQYLGRAHRAFVTPLRDLPWTLVVFRDKQMLRTVNLETVTLATIALAGYSVLLTVVLALIVLLFSESKTRSDRIWPCEERHANYNQIAIVNSGLFLICLVLVFLSSREALIVCALLFPALAIVSSLLLMREGSSTQRPSLSGAPLLANWRRSYSVAMVSMLAIGCVAPTIAFFKLVRDEQILVLIRHGQMSLARGLEQREDQIRDQYDSVDPAVDVGSGREMFVKTRLDRTWDVYDRFFFRTTMKEEIAAGDRPLSGLLCWFLTKCSPLYNETCVETLELVRSGSSDPRWGATETGNKLVLVLRPIGGPNDTDPSAAQTGRIASGDLSVPLATAGDGQQAGNGGRHGWVLTSFAPGFVRFGDPLLWGLVAAVSLMLAGAYVTVSFCARRILLLDMWTPRSLAISVASPVDKNYLVVRPPLFANGDLFPNDAFMHIDLSGVSLGEWWRFDAQLEKARPDLPVVIDRFEVNKHDCRWNLRKLGLVERLIKETRRVLIVSSHDPLSFPLSNGKPNGNGAAPGAEQNADNGTSGRTPGDEGSVVPSEDHIPDVERWSLVLGSFVRRDSIERASSKANTTRSNSVRIGPWPCLEDAPTEDGSNAGEELIAQRADQAETYYRGVWSTCSNEERCTLFRVAQDGLVSRLDPDLRRLMQLGLIVRDPSLKLRDPSFRMFVLAASAAEGVDTFRADVQSSWDRLKAPLLLILLGVIAFLFLTQKELYDSTISLVSALTGAALALLKLIGMFQRSKDAGAGPA